MPTSEVIEVRRFLKKRLATQGNIVEDFANEKNTIHKLFVETFSLGKSNSVLLVGPRGSGKSRLVKAIIDEIVETQEFGNKTLFVYLNGFLHTDDKLALKACASQMRLGNYEHTRTFDSFAANFEYMLDCLKANQTTHFWGVIFIIEEFDLFCAHHNQTLLYNFFDVAQSARAPICVLGLTCRLDVTEILEKRVKSRFSHRQIFLFPPIRNPADRLQFFRKCLELPIDKKNIAKDWIIEWNQSIINLVDNAKIKEAIGNLCNYSCSEEQFKNFLFQIVSLLSEENHLITVDNVLKIHSKYNSDDKASLIKSLSILELCLIITIKHHNDIYDGDPFNFEMILTRFQKFANNSTILKNINRELLLKAFESLQSVELISPVDRHTNSIRKEFQLNRTNIWSRALLQALKTYPTLPTDLEHWANSSLV